MREELTERQQVAETGSHAGMGLERPIFLSPLLGVQKRIAERTAANISVDYAEVNRARDKRKVKRQKNLQQVFSGGYKQIPILK